MAVDGAKATRKTMSAQRNSNNDLPENPAKDPDEWVTGDEQMTGPQASYLKTLAREAGEEFDASLTKAEASRKIDELQHETGRGVDH
jgi:hypothetical protein